MIWLEAELVCFSFFFPFISSKECNCAQVSLIVVYSLYLITSLSLCVCVCVCLSVSLSLSLSLLSYPHTLIDCKIYNSCDEESPFNNQVVHDGDLWEMEVDLRSRRPERRTLHWFVRRNQQRVYFVGVPNTVRFAV